MYNASLKRNSHMANAKRKHILSTYMWTVQSQISHVMTLEELNFVKSVFDILRLGTTKMLLVW